MRRVLRREREGKTIELFFCMVDILTTDFIKVVHLTVCYGRSGPGLYVLLFSFPLLFSAKFDYAENLSKSNFLKYFLETYLYPVQGKAKSYFLSST